MRLEGKVSGKKILLFRILGGWGRHARMDEKLGRTL